MICMKKIIGLCLLFVAVHMKAQKYTYINFSSKNGVVSSYVNTLAQDTKGKLWIGTNRGISIFDGTSFKSVSQINGLANNNIKQLKVSEDGAVWVLHKNGEVSYSKNDSVLSLGYSLDTITYLYKINNELLGLTNTKILSLKDKKVKYNSLLNKRILGITDKGIYAYQRDSLILISSNGNKFVSLDFLDKKEQILIVNNKTIGLGNRSITIFGTNPLQKMFLPEEIIFGKNINNQLYLATRNKLFVFDVNDEITQKQVYEIPLDRQDYSVSDVFLDEEQTLWISTKGGGVFKLGQQHFPILESKNLPLNQVSLLKESTVLVYDNQVWDIVQNRMLYRHYTTGLNTYHRKTNGEQWIGEKIGLSIIVPGAPFAYAFKEMKGKNIIDIFPANNLMIIVSNKAVYSYDPMKNSFEAYIKDKNFEPHSTVKTKETVYLLGRGNIYRFDGNSIASIFSSITDEFEKLTFTSIAFKDGIYYLGTLEKGILTYSKGGKPKSMFLEDDFPSDQITSLGIIKNQLWAATPIGLIKISFNDNSYELYDQSYFNNIDFISSTTYIKDQHLYIPSSEGLVSVNPDLFESNELPAVNLESFLANGEFVTNDSKRTFPYNEKPISFNFSSTSLKSEVYYQYRLLGMDSTWSTPTNQKNVVYNRLPAGEYTFQVRTTGLHSNATGEILEESFSINLPLYKTIGFWFVVVLVILSLVFMFYFTRIIRLRRQKKFLKEEVEKKTFELSAEKKKIEQFSYSLSHDLKNPINNIKGLIEVMEDGGQSNEEVVTMLNDAANQLEYKINKSLEAIKKANEKSNIRAINIREKLEEVEQSLSFLIKKSKAVIEKDIRVDTFIHEDTLLESVLYNLISNAIKYKHPERKPIVEIKTDRVGEYKRIHVLDNGIGIDLKKEGEALFSIFKRVDEQKEVEGSGLGLYMIKQMIELRGGKIEVESQPQLGSKFLVYLKDLKD